MTQATKLTTEELQKLAKIAGLRLCCYSSGREYWGLDTMPICSPMDWHPESNWPQLGMVIGGLPVPWVFGKMIHVDNDTDCWAEVLGYIEHGNDLKLAICRAALAATKERADE